MKAFYSKPIIRIPRHGFTLIELLVVMALTALLFTLALKPLVDTFNLTSRAGTLIESQTAARDIVREIRQTLGNAVYVYDNVQQPINIWVNDQNGNPVAKPTRFAIVQYVLAARQGDQFPGAEEIDPTSGGRMNSNNRNLNGVALPLLPGRTIGRIFIGLANNRLNDTASVAIPFVSYANQFLRANSDNRYLLYRAEAPAFIFDPNTTGQNRSYIPNLMLFHTVDANGNRVDTVNGALQVHDPNFFYDNSPAGGTESGAGTRTWAVPGYKDLNEDGVVQISENWRAIAAPMVFPNKADLITLERDPNTNAINYDNTGVPIVRPLLQLAPAYKENAPAAAGSTNNIGNEAPNAAPTLFATQNANWANPFRVIVYLTNDNNVDPFSASPLTLLYADGSVDNQRRMPIWTTTLNPNQALPLTSAMTEVGPLQNPTTGAFEAPNPFYAMSIDSRRGLINFEFSSGTILQQNGVPVPAYFSPTDVNNSLSIVNNLPRSLDLRTLPNALNGGRLSPLATTRNWYNRVKIVPGSERVIGPDQRPGPNYGYPIAYTRVSGITGTVGRNEYKLNYDDVVGLPDPDDPIAVRLKKGYIQFRGDDDALTPTGTPITNVEDPRVGIYRRVGIPELRFNAATGANELSFPIEVTFNFQTNRSKDVVKVDYLTFEQMKIALEVRYYDPRTGVAQITSLNDTTNVRNLKR